MIEDYLITTALRLKMAKDANGRIEYVGEASPGTQTDEAGWRIKKMTYDGAGFCTGVTWADGVNNMNKIWDSRTDYDYDPDS